MSWDADDYPLFQSTFLTLFQQEMNDCEQQHGILNKLSISYLKR